MEEIKDILNEMCGVGEDKDYIINKIEELKKENKKLKKENEQFKVLNRIIGNNWDYFKEDFEKWEKELIECGFATSEDFEYQDY